MSFILPEWDWEFSLRKGFWVIESFDHYCQIVMHRGRYFWLRDDVYEISKLLGQEEAWYAMEHLTWNGGPTEDLDCTFEDWLDFAIKRTTVLSLSLIANLSSLKTIPTNTRFFIMMISKISNYIRQNWKTTSNPIISQTNINHQ